jgi:hypothetical protein
MNMRMLLSGLLLCSFKVREYNTVDSWFEGAHPKDDFAMIKDLFLAREELSLAYLSSNIRLVLVHSKYHEIKDTAIEKGKH